MLDFLSIGVGAIVKAIRVADRPAALGWVGGGAIGAIGLNCKIWVKSGRLIKASSCLGFLFGILILRDRATLLADDIHDLPEEITLTPSACF